MYSSLRGSLRACTFRGVVAILPVAMICAYAPPSELPSRLVTAQVENTAEIVSSPSSIGIADSGLYGETQAQINQTLDTLQSIGVQDVRVFVPWIYVEPGNGVYNWSSIDMVIQAAQARNMGDWFCWPWTRSADPIPAPVARFKRLNTRPAELM